jgi:alkanesulfonate monooxygenase SsuD/methylene tetrahydromethanopterin reductase-like flavin-dependent oxidoreductase (luciferase family)
MEESVDRFEEGVTQVRRLLSEEHVAEKGRFHSFPKVTSLPRPTQRPHPPIYLAAVGTPDSFARAGQLGYGIMAIPGVGSTPSELVEIYREAWKEAGHAGRPRVMLAVFMFCHEDREVAVRLAKPRIERHFDSIADAMTDYAKGVPASTYRNYDRMREKILAETFETQVHHMAAFVGTPADLIEQFRAFDAAMGGCDHASLQVNFNDMPIEDAERSVRLFGEKVIPAFAS